MWLMLKEKVEILNMAEVKIKFMKEKTYGTDLFLNLKSM